MTKTTARRVPHRSRNGIQHDVLHIAMHLVRDLPNMRTKAVRACILDALRAARGRFGCRFVEFAILDNHIHLVVESRDGFELGRAMKGLAVRIARGLNKLWGRSGQVFTERYFHRVVRKVHELRRLVRYVLQNARRHGVRVPDDRPDECSSGPWFRHWHGHLGRTFSSEPSPLDEASSMALQCALRFVIELTDRPDPPPPLPGVRKRRLCKLV